MAKRDKSWIFLSAAQPQDKAFSDLDSTKGQSMDNIANQSTLDPIAQLNSQDKPLPTKLEPDRRKMLSTKLKDNVTKNGLKLKNFSVMQKLSAARGVSSNNICMTSFHHPHEQRQLTEAAQKLRDSKSISEAYEVLDQWSLEGLFTSIPYSLPLLEVLYTNFMDVDRQKFPLALLRPDVLMQHILWWAAFEDTANAGKASYKLRDDLGMSLCNTGVSMGCSTLSKRPEAHCWITVLPNITSLVKITHVVAPNLHNTLIEERKRLEKILESLGLHGLVNCGETQLIDISDAVRSELTSHQHKLKTLVIQYDKNLTQDISKINLLLKSPNNETAGVKNSNSGTLYSVEGGLIPSSANHQRLMGLKMSEIRNRVHRNETTLHTLRLALRNNDLESLERILQKRIGYDKDVLNQVNGLRQNSTSGYTLASEDPIVSGVLVQFKKAYDKLLGVFPSDFSSPRRVRTTSSPNSRLGDSGIGEDDSGDSLHGSEIKHSPPSSDSRSSLSPLEFGDNCGHVKTGRLLGPVAQLIQAKSKRFHRSLQDINQLTLSDPLYSNPQDLSFPLSASKSTSQILTNDPNMYPYQAQVYPRDHIDRMEMGRLQSEVSRLSRDLAQSNKLVHQLTADNSRVAKDRDYCGSNSSSASSSSAGRAVSNLPRLPYNCLDDSDQPDPHIPQPVQKYRTLFTKDRVDTIKQLNTLPELKDSPELQMKIIFSVVVLSFRSVSEALSGSKNEVWSVFNITPTEEHTEYTKDLTSAIYRFMLNRAKTNNGMDNAKEVTAQIWRTLYDFPSLKTCVRFNRLILDCIQVAWDLLAGVDGNPPRFRLDYDASNEFNCEKHLRFQGSSLRSSQILRFIWPGLIECQTENCVYKGVVMT